MQFRFRCYRTPNTIGRLALLIANQGLQVDSTGDLIVTGPVNNGVNALAIRTGRNLRVDQNDGPAIASSGPVLLAAGIADQTGGLTLNGDIQSTAGRVQLAAAGGGMIIGATVTAGFFNQVDNIGFPAQLSVRADGHVAFGPNGRFSAPGGTIEVAPATTGEAMTVGGTGPGLSVDPIAIAGVSGQGSAPLLVRLGRAADPISGALTTSAGSLTLVGNPFAPGPTIPTLELDAAGSIAELPAAAIVGAQTLTGTAGSLNLGNNGNRVAGLGILTSAGDLEINDADPLTIVAPVQAGNGHLLSVSAPSITVQASGNVAGSLSVQPDTTVSPAKGGSIALATGALVAGGPIQAPSGLVAIAPLAAGQAISIDPAGQATPGALSLTPGTLAKITTNGPSGRGTLALGSTSVGAAATTASAIAINAPLDLTGTAGALGLFATGPITQTAAGTLVVGRLVGPAAGATPDGSLALAVAGNRIASIGPFNVGGTLALSDATDLTLAAPVGAANATFNVAGNLVIADAVTGNTVALNAGGAIGEVRLGRIEASALAGQAMSATLGGANQVAALGRFSTNDGFLLNNAAPLTIAGPLSDLTSISVTNRGAVSLTGDLSAPAVSLAVGDGGITQASGSLTAGTLTGRASGIAQFGSNTPGPVARVGTLRSFSVPDGNLSLFDAGPLMVETLTAGNFQIVAPGQLTLAGGEITTTGLSVGAQSGATPAAPGSFFSVRPSQGSDGFVQTGTTTIQPLAGTGATVRVDVGPGGTVNFANLVAPNANLVLGVASGTAAGAIDVGSLLVLGQTGGSTLTGAVNANTGPAAAAAATIQPRLNANYLLNGCEIGVANCGRSPPPPPRPPNFASVVRNTSPSTLLRWRSLAQMAAGTDAELAPQLPGSEHIRPRTVILGIAYPPATPGETNPELVLPGVSGRDD